MPVLDLVNGLADASRRSDPRACLADATRVVEGFLVSRGMKLPQTSRQVAHILEYLGYRFAASEYLGFVKQYAEQFIEDDDEPDVCVSVFLAQDGESA